MTEEKLIEKMAQLWVENGGDADGIDWCKEKIKAKIKELREKNDSIT